MGKQLTETKADKTTKKRALKQTAAALAATAEKLVKELDGLPLKDIIEGQTPKFADHLNLAADRIENLERENHHQAEKLWLVTELLKLGHVRADRRDTAGCVSLSARLRDLAQKDEAMTSLGKKVLLDSLAKPGGKAAH